jgi:protein TonB
MEDKQVQEEPPKTAVDELDKTKDIGATDQDGDKDAPPTDIPDEIKPGIIESAPPPPEEKPYEMFDLNKPPTFPGGEKEMLRFLAENIKYPPLARENNIQGNVALSFIVGKDGTVSGLEILKDIGGGCGKEAIRVVQTMPKWSPGEANGHPVKVRFTLPVRFRLE